VSTAHYLSRLLPSLAIHLLDSSPQLFASASGKAGGFLARDWFRRSTASLGALSFDLHRQLAEEYDGPRRWGYSPTTAVSLSESRLHPNVNGKRGEDWLLEGRRPSAAAGVRHNDPVVLPPWLSAGRSRDCASPHAKRASSEGATAQVCVVMARLNVT